MNDSVFVLVGVIAAVIPILSVFVIVGFIVVVFPIISVFVLFGVIAVVVSIVSVFVSCWCYLSVVLGVIGLGTIHETFEQNKQIISISS